MATRLKEVDAVMVGMGWTGSILARCGPPHFASLHAGYFGAMEMSRRVV